MRIRPSAINARRTNLAGAGLLREQEKSANTTRRAIILVAVLLVVVVLSLLGYQYLDLMTAEYRTAQNVHDAAQTRALAESGINYAAIFLGGQTNTGGIPTNELFNNPNLFQSQVVMSDATSGRQGMFSIMAPAGLPGDQNSGSGVRYGVIDENGKINLNAMIRQDKTGNNLYNMLIKLPMLSDNQNVAAAIVDWIDGDSEPRDNGAEADAYSGLTPPYYPKNGPLESLDELLLVQGMTPQLLYGNDLNRNGMIDGNETASDPTTDLGLSGYLTIYSREQNISSGNTQRLDLNEKDLSTLYPNLVNAVGEDLATFIVLYRQNGGKQISTSSSSSGSSGSSSGSSGGSSNKSSTTKSTTKTTGGDNDADDVSKSNTSNNSSNSNNSSSSNSVAGNLSDAAGSLDLTKKASNKINSLFDLLNSQVTVPGQNKNDPSIVYDSPLNSSDGQQQLLPALFDQTTVNNQMEIPARVNINTAPPPVIAALPGLSNDNVQTILSTRPSLDSLTAADPIFQTPAWLMLKANIPLNTVKGLEKYVNTRSQVYRVQSIGYFDKNGPFTRLEAVIDTNAGRPRIIMFRDLSLLGKGFATSATK